MKRTITLAVGFLVLGVAAYSGSQLSAQQQNNQPAPASLLRNKVAIFNMSKVIKEYKRWQDFEAQRNSELKQQQSKFDKFKNELQVKQGELAKATPSDTTKREQLANEIRAIERSATDLREELQRRYSKWEQEQITTIYKEIEAVAHDIARAYQVEVILHYTDPTTPEEKYHPMNLARKLQSSGITPIYMAPGIDISQWILDNLNRRYQASAAPPAGAGNTGKQQ